MLARQSSLRRSRSHDIICKAAFSREYVPEYPTDPLLLAKSLAAKSRECVQYQGSNWQQQQQQRAGHLPTHGILNGNSSSSRTWEWLGQALGSHTSTAAKYQRSSSSSRSIARRQQLSKPIRALNATATAAAVDITSRLAAAAPAGGSSTAAAGSSSILLTQPGAAAAPNSSSSSSSSSVFNQQAGVHSATAVPAAEQQQQQHQLLDAAWSGTMSALSATAATTEVAAAAAAAAAAAQKTPAGPSSSKHGTLPATGSSSSSSRSKAGISPARTPISSYESHDDSDWLTAVLSDSTSRLSVHSNAVLTNSLKRLASLRTLGGAGAAAAATAGAAAAAAVEGSEGLSGLLEGVRVRFGTFQLQHFEEVALQLAQLGYQPDDDWLASFERHSLRVMPGGSPRLLSRLLLARAKLSGGCSSSWCAACLKHMTAKPERLTVSSWVNALWALVRMKQMPDRHFQAVFFQSSAERLDDVSPELLNNLVWSLARLQLAPSYLWWRRLVQAAATIEKPFTHSQLASLIHSVTLWADPGGIAPRDVQVLIDLLLVEVDVQLSVMQPAELTMIVWSLGSLTAAGKLVPDWEIQARLLEAVQSQLPRLNPSQLSSLCWGLAKLDQGLPEGFAEALLLEVQAQMQGFADGALANVMWALAKVALQPGAAFREALWEDLHARCHRLAVQDMCTLLWALARLHLQPPTDLMQELLDQSTPQLLSCDPSQLANLTWALGRLQAAPSLSWLSRFEEASVQILPAARLQDLVNLAWGRSELAQQRVSDGGFVGNPHPASVSWQAAVLRELRLRCRCLGHEMDCLQLVQVLKEMGVQGLSEGAAAAEASFWADDDGSDGCPVEFQPGCK